MKSPVLLYALAAAFLLIGCSKKDSVSPRAPTSNEQTKASAPTSPQPDPELVPQDKSPGLAVGEHAPAFELQDQHGQSQTLTEMLTSSNVALVFYRSADW